MQRTTVTIAAILLVLASGAAAQESRSEISLQGAGFFTKNSTGGDTTRQANDTGGFLVTYRYRLNRWLAAEGAYGFDRNTQQYSTPAGSFGGQVNVQQATGGLVVRLPATSRWRLSPYLLAEGGALSFSPRGNGFNTDPVAESQTRGVFVYGGGANFPIVKHVSLRAEYRGLVYSAPNFGLTSLGSGPVTHTAEPSLGIVFRF
jgi:opacity protein-like surface antigen